MNACPTLTAEVAPELSSAPTSDGVRLRRLLVPLDFSAGSIRAYHYARALCHDLLLRLRSRWRCALSWGGFVHHRIPWPSPTSSRPSGVNTGLAHLAER